MDSARIELQSQEDAVSTFMNSQVHQMPGLKTCAHSTKSFFKNSNDIFSGANLSYLEMKPKNKDLNEMKNSFVNHIVEDNKRRSPTRQ